VEYTRYFSSLADVDDYKIIMERRIEHKFTIIRAFLNDSFYTNRIIGYYQMILLANIPIIPALTYAKLATDIVPKLPGIICILFLAQ
jgi:hypothetical protein